MNVRFALAIALLLIAANGQAQRATAYERVLLPIVIRGEGPGIRGELLGAEGSRWTTEISIENAAGRRVDILGYDHATRGCLAVCVPGLTPPDVTFFPTVRPGKKVPAGLLLIDRDAVDDVRVHLRVLDMSRASGTAGTEIPTVRARDTFQRPFNLVDVSLTPGFRETLRLYDLDGVDEARVTVRFYKADPTLLSPIEPFGPPAVPDILLKELSFTLVTEQLIVGEIAAFGTFKVGYGELWDFSRLPELQGATTVRIEIEPSTPGLRLWAFVSLTHNETQHVTLISPQ